MSFAVVWLVQPLCNLFHLAAATWNCPHATGVSDTQGMRGNAGFCGMVHLLANSPVSREN